MTSDITVISQRDTDFEMIAATHSYDGSYFPTQCAGFVVDECAVVCHQCHDKEEDSTERPIFGTSEWDFPGHGCHDCGKFLDVRLLVYESGPGSEVYQEYANE
jgi:hypothetical protein